MPEEKKQPTSAFIEYLIRLADDGERGALAVLQRGLGYPPGESVEMYRYVARFVPDEARGGPREKAYYLIASLFAFHRLHTEDALSFGSHMAQLAKLEEAKLQKVSTATERRFAALLNADQADMASALRQAVSLLKSKEIKINWTILFRDVQNWALPGKPVQRRWANDFWAYQKPAADPQLQPTEKEN